MVQPPLKRTLGKVSELSLLILSQQAIKQASTSHGGQSGSDLSQIPLLSFPIFGPAHPSTVLITANICPDQRAPKSGSFSSHTKAVRDPPSPHLPVSRQLLTWARPRPCLTVDGRPPTECRLPPKLHPVSAASPPSPLAHRDPTQLQHVLCDEALSSL